MPLASSLPLDVSIRAMTPLRPQRGVWRRLKRHRALAAMSAVLLLLCAGGLTCSRMENPYLDRTKCGIVITGPRIDGDTLSIFSPQQFSVELLLQAHIAAIAFSADSNYAWRPGDSVIERSSFGNAYSFPFSVAFSDTGWKTLRAIALLDNGTEIGDSMRVYCISPLDQPDIISDAGKTVALTTTPVAEPLAFYIWKLGAADSVWNYQPSQIWYTDRILSGTGQLYVRLFGKNIRSPARLFKISVADQTAPLISCLNASAYGIDRAHVAAGAPPFFLQIEIRDQASALKQAQANGAPFSRIDTLNEKTWRCVKEISTLPAAGDSLSLIVSAKDAYDNTASKMFWIHYDSSVVMRPSLVITDPASNPATVAKRFVAVRGGAADIEGYDSLFVFFANAGADSAPRVITPLAPQWQWLCPLAADTVTLRFALAAGLGGGRYDTLDIAAITVIFDAAAVDTIPPSIDTVYAGATPVTSGFQTPSSPLTLTVRPFDQSGIAAVTVNGAAAAYQGSNAWSASVPLMHTAAGNTVRIVAIDSAGNSGEAVRLIYRNISPRILRMPRVTFATVGSVCLDTVEATDADGDSLALTVRIAAASGVVVRHCDARGAFSWTPAPADTGQTDVLVQISDGYPAIVDSAYRITVNAAAKAVHKARFITTAADFPDTITAGQPWVFTLKINMPPESGRYVFTAQIAGSGAYLLQQSADSVIRWTPTLQDTGLRTLRVIVHSSIDSADSIEPQPRIAVVAPQLWSVKFTAASSSASESAGAHSVGVELNRPSDGAVSIGYAVQWGAGTTADSLDFRLAAPQRLVFAPGASAATIPVTIVDDVLPEVTEYLILKLTDPVPKEMAQKAPSTHILSIIDNDDAALGDTIAISTADAAGPEAPSRVVVTIAASSPLRKDVQLRIITGGSAQQGNNLDYTISPVDIAMRRGDRTASVAIVINDDAVCEPLTEQISLTLRAATPNVVVTDSQFTYAILPSDAERCDRIIAFLYRQKPISAFEKAICDTITKMGYGVYPLARDEIKYADLLYFNAVMISASLGDAKLGDSLAELPVPILSSSLETSVGLGLVSGSPLDSGAAMGQALDVRLGDRFWTRVPITVAPVSIPWIHPAIAGEIVARIPKFNMSGGNELPGSGPPSIGIDTLRAAVFHAAPDLFGSEADLPARRAVFTLCRPSAGAVVEYTPSWWALLKASVEWTAMGGWRIQPMQKRLER